MLFKNNRKPALAYAAYQGNNAEKSKIDKDFITHMSAEEDDFGNFSSSTPAREAKPPRKKQAPKKANKPHEPSRKKNYRPFIIAGIAALALILIIVLIVVIVNLANANTKIEDTVYFTYKDGDDQYHVLVDGKEIKTTFSNEIKLIPADDRSFAYIFEYVEEDANGASGIRMHILKGKKLKSSEVLADEYITYSPLNPGIVYKYKNSYLLYTDDTEDLITREKSADNFVISGDAKTVVYTMESKQTEGINVLKYFQGSGSDDVQNEFTPIALSHDGRYIYGTADRSGSFYYIDMKTKKEDRKPKRITNESYGDFGEITEMNAKGDEIIFYTDKDGTIYSFFYKVKDKAPTSLAKGVFNFVSPDAKILAPDTFIGKYFESYAGTLTRDDDGNIDLDLDSEDSSATYCLKKDGAIKIADALGKFSPDGKYFYFIDEDGQLMRTSLSSEKYEENLETVYGSVTEFELTQKGDIYMLSESGDEKTAFLKYCDASTKKSTTISGYADIGSMRVSSNTIYFSETLDNSDEESTTVYTSTDGSAKSRAEFKSVNLKDAPEIEMGIGKKGYAYFTDEDDVTTIFYTSNGKKFELVCKDCILPDSKAGSSSNKTQE